MSPHEPSSLAPSRRDFLKTTAAAGAVGSLALGRMAHAQGSDELKVGLVGCGGRGTGAAVNALAADPNTKITALADVFPERLENSRNALQRRDPKRGSVADDHCFVGFDAYQKVIDSGVDVVILATSPHFRPMQLKACIEAGKHVFCEKPVAVDAPGVRSVMATGKAADEKGLSIVSGLCWRYAPIVKETMQRVLDGAIGDIHTLQETYLTGTLWHRGRREDDTEMAYQMRNWLYFTWLSGDFNTEQHIHSLDKGSWAMGDRPPTRVWGMGGREVRTDPKWGDIYDHHAVVYEYDNGARMYAFCRQMGGCYNDVSDQYTGTKGKANILAGRISGDERWRYRGPGGNMYELEHEALFKAIRSGEPINNSHYMALSTMLAIAGRMVDYTGKAYDWDELIGNDQMLAPKEYTWEADPPTMPGEDGRYPIATPGVTTLG